MALVSLISGCLNGEKFIHRCFSSVLEQTYHNVEFIFINDGSTDNTLEIAENYRDRFEAKGYKFIIISQQNMGFYPQSGIKIATGKYISTLDIDDVLLPKSIEKRVEFLENNSDFSAVRTNGVYMNENNLENSLGLFVKEYSEKKNTNIFFDLLYGKTNNWAGSYMVRSEKLFQFYPDKVVPMNRFGQNLQILLPVSYENKVGFIDEVLMKYIKHEQSFTKGSNSYNTKVEQYNEFKKIRLSLLKKIKIKDSVIINKLNSLYDNILLSIAFEYNKKDNFNDIFSIIKKKSLEQKIMYAKINQQKVSYFLLRVIRSIKSKL